MENRIIEEVASLKTTVAHHEKRIEKVEDSTAILGRMELLLEQQMEMNKEQNITLSKINDNLDNLNASQIQMQEEMKTMNNRIQKVEEKQVEEIEKSTLDLRGIPKKTIMKILSIAGLIITGVIIYYVNTWLGVKK